MKDNLVDIEVDDLIIVSTRNNLQLKKVTKRTSTQIHVNDIKYRIDGSEITSEKWNFSSIYAPLQKSSSSELTWFEVYQNNQNKLKEEKEVLITQIQAFDLTKVSIGKLKNILKELN